MDRKSFLKKGLLGAAGVAAGSSLIGKSTYDKLKEQVGFNHLPNQKDIHQINSTMKTVLHKANTRGHANHGWLDSHHTFSFANYYNPERMHFGVLRVLNDDVVAGGRGFGRHPHDNMEIISIPLSGALKHKDSMGNEHVIRQGEVQVMSAGTGVYHSEMNESENEEVRFLQIWVFPREKGVTPRYDQQMFDDQALQDKLMQVVSPNQDDDGTWVHQDIWFSRGKFTKEQALNYKVNKKGNGVYFFLIDGSASIADTHLTKRDGFGVWDTDQIDLTVNEGTDLLVMEVPMSI